MKDQTHEKEKEYSEKSLSIIEDLDRRLTRRKFLKMTSVAGAGVFSFGLAGCTKLLSGDDKKLKYRPYTEDGALPIADYVEKSGCMWCQNGCSMLVHIKDGRVVNISGNPDDPVTKGKICLKPLGSVELLYSKYRLKTPLKRVGPHGTDRFTEISWEEALDEIAEKLKSVKEKYGGEALGMWVSGRSAANGRDLNGPFAKLFGTPNRAKTGPFCNYSAKVAGVATVGDRCPPWTYEIDDFLSADWYMFVGSNMAATRPVTFGRLNNERIKRKCKFIVVDPRQTESASKADLWLPIRPGTDMALALSMMYHIFAEKIEDKDFIARNVVGADRLKDFLNQRGYTPEWAEEVTGISAATIKQIAEEYATTRKAIIMGNSGLSHHTNAVQTHRAFYMLAAITGHFGEPGMGYGCGNNGSVKRGSISVPKEMIPKTMKQIRQNPAGWLDAMITGKPYPIRAFISTGSPLTQWPEQNKVRKALSKLELSVYNELFPNVNTPYFDYILPAATWVEAGGPAPVSDDRRWVWVPKLIKEPYNTKTDRWWWIELGKRMGWGDIFKEKYKDHEKLENAVAAKTGFTVERFIRSPSNALRGPIPSKDTPEARTIFISGEKFPGKDKQFPTKSGKIEIWSEELEKKFGVYGLSALPEFYADPENLADLPYLEYIDSDEDPGIPSPFQKNKTLATRVRIASETTLDQARIKTKYPLYLTTGRPSAAFMGNSSHWAWLLADTMPDQYCMIHPRTAGKLGIKTEDSIEIESARGKTKAKAWVYTGIREDTVFVPYSWGEKQPCHGYRTINFLTESTRRCPLSGQTNFKALLCRVKKIFK